MSESFLLTQLVDQFGQRFRHDPRASVCLWFDERKDFAPLLPHLIGHLGDRPAAPFTLLAYNRVQKHGEIWLRWQIHQAELRAKTDSGERPRFVVYLPLAETEPLELLAEYRDRVAGLTWRIGGKRPTLFTFLRQVGVPLPDGQSEQRRLTDGGDAAPLARYAARYARQTAAFWQRDTLTPELVRERLVEDVDKWLFDLAAQPQATWAELEKLGLRGDVLEALEERYGVPAASTPIEYVQTFVTVVAVCETFLGYGEPPDFPLLDRLPPAGKRGAHRALVERWLRDGTYRTAWDSWITRVEKKIDLSDFARTHQGLSFAFPHLVSLRWKEIAEKFEVATEKRSAVDTFFEAHGTDIAREAGLLGRASNGADEHLLERLHTLAVLDNPQHRTDGTRVPTTKASGGTVYAPRAPRAAATNASRRALAASVWPESSSAIASSTIPTASPASARLLHPLLHRLATLLHPRDVPPSSTTLATSPSAPQIPDSSPETALLRAPALSCDIAGPVFDSRRLHNTSA